MTNHQPLLFSFFFFLWRQLIPTCTQRLGSAQWTKWQQSSWPLWLRPAEWSSLCPHGHRGLPELGCFLRGHLAGLCSYPSNAGIGISTWFRGGLVMDSRKIAYMVMTCRMHTVIKRLAGLHTHEPTILQTLKYVAIAAGWGNIFPPAFDTWELRSGKHSRHQLCCQETNMWNTYNE